MAVQLNRRDDADEKAYEMPQGKPSLETISENMAQETKKNSGRKHDLLPKILSVFAAFCLWLYVYQAVEVEKEFKDVPISLNGFDTSLDLDIAAGYQNTVDVTVRGTNSAVGSVEADDISVSVDMSEITSAGTYKLPVVMRLPNGLTEADASSDVLTVTVDKTVTRTISVEPELDYVIQSPYEMGEPMWEPKTVTVRGPERDVMSIARAVLETRLTDVRNDVRSSLSVKLVDGNGYELTSEYIFIEPARVDLRIPVKKTSRVPVKAAVEYDETKYTVSCSPKYAYISGAVNEVEMTDEIGTDPIYVAKEGTYTLPVSVPEGIAVYSGYRKSDEEKLTEVRITVTAKTPPVQTPATVNVDKAAVSDKGSKSEKTQNGSGTDVPTAAVS